MRNAKIVEIYCSGEDGKTSREARTKGEAVPEERCKLLKAVCQRGPARRTCILGVALQPELTPIRPPPALLSDRFQLCRRVTPTNYGGVTRNRLDCDLKL